MTGEPGNKKMQEMLDVINAQPTKFGKMEKIKYTESIEMIMPNGLKRWIKIRVSGEGFTIEEAAQNAKEKFNKALQAINPSLPIQEETAPASRELPVVDRRKEALKDIIQDCHTLHELLKIKPDCDKYGLWQEYVARYEQIEKNYLNNQTTQHPPPPY